MSRAHRGAIKALAGWLSLAAAAAPTCLFLLLIALAGPPPAASGAPPLYLSLCRAYQDTAGEPAGAAPSEEPASERGWICPICLLAHGLGLKAPIAEFVLLEPAGALAFVPPIPRQAWAKPRPILLPPARAPPLRAGARVQQEDSV
jgi:hypothetical protein